MCHKKKQHPTITKSLNFLLTHNLEYDSVATENARNQVYEAMLNDSVIVKKGTKIDIKIRNIPIKPIKISTFGFLSLAVAFFILSFTIYYYHLIGIGSGNKFVYLFL